MYMYVFMYLYLYIRICNCSITYVYIYMYMYMYSYVHRLIAVPQSLRLPRPSVLQAARSWVPHGSDRRDHQPGAQQAWVPGAIEESERERETNAVCEFCLNVYVYIYIYIHL